VGSRIINSASEAVVEAESGKYWQRQMPVIWV